MVSDKQTTESYAKTHPLEAFVREPLCLLWVLRHITILIMFDDIRPWSPSPDSYYVQHIGGIYKRRQEGLLESKCLYSTINSEGVPRVHEGRLKDVETTSSTNGKIKYSRLIEIFVVGPLRCIDVKRGSSVGCSFPARHILGHQSLSIRVKTSFFQLIHHSRECELFTFASILLLRQASHHH